MVARRHGERGVSAVRPTPDGRDARLLHVRLPYASSLATLDRCARRRWNRRRDGIAGCTVSLLEQSRRNQESRHEVVFGGVPRRAGVYLGSADRGTHLEG